mgnify:CR=1 FL=1
MKKIDLLVSVLALVVMLASCGEEEKKGLVNKDKVRAISKEVKKYAIK